MRRKRLEPSYWDVYAPPGEAPHHNHLAGVPCVDCKRPIWWKDPVFTIKGVGYVRDKLGRLLRRSRTFMLCEVCNGLRHEFKIVRGHWPGVGKLPPWLDQPSLMEWVESRVEHALEAFDA